MSDNVEELLNRKNQLTKELASLQNKAAIAKNDADRLKKEITESLGELKSKFGCDSYKEAVAKRDSLVKEANEILDNLEGEISALEGR